MFLPPARFWGRLDAMTFHVERIDHVVLRVRDLPAMVRFYEQALGFKVERTPGPASAWCRCAPAPRCST